ncbi:MAG: glycosyltransferase [Microgenomates group bacterium]
MKHQKTIIITGTHHTPAIELINQLKKDSHTDWKIIYIAHQYKTESHISHTLIPKYKLDFYNLECGKFDRRNLSRSILGVPITIQAIFRAYQVLRKNKPNIIVSFGGYVSVPVIIAGYLLHIPSITHEQTLTMSLSTKINSHFATRVAVSFPHKNAVLTGNLMRQEIFFRNSDHFQHSTLPFIYITGGNQGSLFLNKLTYRLVPRIANYYSVIHQTGQNIDPQLQQQLLNKYPNYHPLEYIDSEDIGWVLNNSSYIISRSGANICQEIDLLDKRSILIPLPFTQQDEQQKNAQWLKSMHPQTTTIINQPEATVTHIISHLQHTDYQSQPKSIPLVHPLVKLINEVAR